MKAAHLVLVENPGGHAGDDEEEKWKELQSSRKEDSALGVRDVLAGQSPLYDHLEWRFEGFFYGNFVIIVIIVVSLRTKTWSAHQYQRDPMSMPVKRPVHGRSLPGASAGRNMCMKFSWEGS